MDEVNHIIRNPVIVLIAFIFCSEILNHSTIITISPLAQLLLKAKLRNGSQILRSILELVADGSFPKQAWKQPAKERQCAWNPHRSDGSSFGKQQRVESRTSMTVYRIGVVGPKIILVKLALTIPTVGESNGV